MNILITGFSGFVSRHFIEYLYNENVQAYIIGIDVREPIFDTTKYDSKLMISFVNIDLLDQDSVFSLINDYKPNYILHLASYSSVAYSWDNPVESFKNNTNIFLNLISAVKDLCPNCRILSVGSSEEYGKILDRDIPLSENQGFNPVSPYADSFGMNIILTRSFNHIGPWQDDRFVVPGFAKRIMNIRNQGKQKGTIKTGDLSIVRDFVDVRDVVRAYWLLLTKGVRGEVYNVCSGHGYKLEKIIQYISEIVEVEVDTETVSEFIRPNDNPVIIGDYSKIYTAFGWKPMIDIRTSLEDIVRDIEERK